MGLPRSSEPEAEVYNAWHLLKNDNNIFVIEITEIKLEKRKPLMTEERYKVRFFSGYE